jgi:type I restriction enzyme S subunit
VIRIRPNRNLITGEFLNAYLNSPPGQDAVQAQSRTTSGLRTLSVGRIRRISVPLLTLAEQERVVSALDALHSESDRLGALQAGTAVELDALLPAVLDRAFRGELI